MSLPQTTLEHRESSATYLLYQKNLNFREMGWVWLFARYALHCDTGRSRCRPEPAHASPRLTAAKLQVQVQANALCKSRRWAQGVPSLFLWLVGVSEGLHRERGIGLAKTTGMLLAAQVSTVSIDVSRMSKRMGRSVIGMRRAACGPPRYDAAVLSAQCSVLGAHLETRLNLHVQARFRCVAERWSPHELLWGNAAPHVAV